MYLIFGKIFYISEFIFRDHYLNNDKYEYNKIIIFDDENVSIEKIYSIFQNQYNLVINKNKFFKVIPDSKIGITENKVNKVFEIINNQNN